MTYWDEVTADSPVFLLKMEEASGNLTDEIGSKTGTQSGSPTYRVTGPSTGIPYGITFPAGAYFSFADHADLDLGDGPFTIEWWFARHDAAVGGDILGKTGASPDTTGYNVTITSSDRIRLRFGNNGENIQSLAAVLNDTNWHHAVATRGTATSGSIYVDGAEASTSETAAVTFTDNTTALTLGRRTATSGSFLGTIAAVAIYKSELSATRVLAHFDARNSTADTDASAQMVTGTFTSYAPSPIVKPQAGLATITGAAYAAAPAANGSAFAEAAGIDVWASAALRSEMDVDADLIPVEAEAFLAATAIATDPVPSVSVNAEVALMTIRAYTRMRAGQTSGGNLAIGSGSIRLTGTGSVAVGTNRV